MSSTRLLARIPTNSGKSKKFRKSIRQPQNDVRYWCLQSKQKMTSRDTFSVRGATRKTAPTLPDGTVQKVGAAVAPRVGGRGPAPGAGATQGATPGRSFGATALGHQFLETCDQGCRQSLTAWPTTTGTRRATRKDNAVPRWLAVKILNFVCHISWHTMHMGLECRGGVSEGSIITSVQVILRKKLYFYLNSTGLGQVIRMFYPVPLSPRCSVTLLNYILRVDR